MTQQDSAMEMQQLVSTMVRGLVDETEAVRVNAIPENGRCVLHVRVAENDIPKLIGRSGNTARSLRTILFGASRRLGMPAELDIDGADARNPDKRR